MNEMVKVGIADMQVIRGEGKLITYALGSCVGVCLYERKSRIAGMIHVMLSSIPPGSADNPLKYADSGIPLLISKMERLGGSRLYMTAKIAGGAKMFEVLSGSAMANIGDRNTAMVKEVLQKNRIRLIAEDTGSNCARTMEFFADTGEAVIRSYGRPDYRL